MHPFHIIGILTTLAAAFGLVNHHLLRLQPTVGLMLQSMLLSLGLMVLQLMGIPLLRPVQQVLGQIDFNLLLLEGMLSFLIFAGALFVKNEELLNVKMDIAIFATAGVMISTGVTGFLLLVASKFFGLGLSPVYCFLFGALISPTDPVAVLPLLRSHGLPERLNAQIAGEALFNDGIGIVVFLSLLLLSKGTAAGVGEVSLLFLREAAGGVAFGAVVGYAGYLLLKTLDDYQLEILLTLAMVTGGYSLAISLGISGPLAMVVAALLVGGPGRRHAMSERTRENLDRFWEMVEVMLNSILFTLIGLEVLVIFTRLNRVHVLAAVAALPVVLVGRAASVAAVGFFLRCCGTFVSRSLPIMTWSGLRGGIPIALALSLPGVPERGPLLFATYVVVAFSILVQGTTLKFLLPHQENG